MSKINHLQNSFKLQQIYLLVFCIFSSLVCLRSTCAQSVTDINTPLVPGALSSGPYVVPPQGAYPPIGSGYAPLPVTPGMIGSPTLPPSVLNSPANNIDLSNSNNYPSFDPSMLSTPGTLGPSLTGQIPGVVSTPGNDPGSLYSNFGSNAAIVSVTQGGGLANGQAPIVRRSAQDTRDFGLSKIGKGSLTVDYGIPLSQNPNLAVTPQYSQDGARAAMYPGQYNSINRASNLPNAQETISLYGSPILFKGASNPPLQTYAPY